MEIAVYGKGGIGKSTISANLSVALAMKGKTVLQIGCDPKHDSTRLLLHGRSCITALDYIKKTGAADYRIEEILNKGVMDIGCIEAGGPTPGVGCAGRGIITVFELLDNFKVKENYEIVVYDVLGDVVCGGFAVPIRSEYADTIFLVTSGEYMSIYAANNILRGILNYDGEKKRVAGILYNKRDIEGEDQRVKKFAEAVGLPICATFPRSDAFSEADRKKITVMEGECSIVKDIFSQLAEDIVSDLDLYKAKPLSDEDLEEVVLGVKTKKVKTIDTIETNKEPEKELVSEELYLSKNIVRDEPLHGCAFNGAISQCIHIMDTAVLAHAPKSCAHLVFQSISSSGRRTLFERGALLPVSISPNLRGTDMGEQEMVFGGMDKLKDKIQETKKEKPKAIIVVSSCPSGIIGDDIDQIQDLEGDIPVITLKADGNLTGDYLQGMLMAFTGLAKQIIRKDVKPVKNLVNIVFEKVVAKNTNSNYEIVKNYLSAFDVKINCRFLCETDYDSLANFKAASLNLLAYRDYTSNILQDFFEKNYDVEFFENPFPVGFLQTAEWLEGIGEYFDKPSVAKEIIENNTIAYEDRVKAVKAQLKGKKLMVITYNHDIDWILKSAIDVGIKITKLCILNFSQDEGFRTKLGRTFNFEENYDKDKRIQDIELYKPDILLTNYESSIGTEGLMTFTMPMCPDVGFFSGITECEKWARLKETNLLGEWKNDEELFRKYNS